MNNVEILLTIATIASILGWTMIYYANKELSQRKQKIRSLENQLDQYFKGNYEEDEDEIEEEEPEWEETPSPLKKIKNPSKRAQAWLGVSK